MGTSASFARKAVACLAAALLTLALVPTSALAQGQGEAEQPQGAVDSQAGETQEASADQADEGSGSTSAASLAEGGTLASALVGAPTAFINSDVALDSEPVVGSFTVDGLTFAVTEGSDVELVGVSSDRQQVTSPQEGVGSPVAPMLASGPAGFDADSSTLALPESITYDGVDYAVTSIGAYAFYLSGVTAVELPATVADVDDRAFRSSDVVSVEVADGNPTYSSFDGALYSADQTSLLLIPEGKQGTVLLPKRAEVADVGKFSHCSLASAIAVEEGSAAFASENGLLYDASLTTLLRVPAGATDIVIRDGCTTIAAGALEACASLATITAPASVTSISPDVFTSVPTVSLPVAALVEDAPQLSAMVALSSTEDDLPKADSAAIEVILPYEGSEALWADRGFEEVSVGAETSAPSAYLQQSVAARAYDGYVAGDSSVWVLFATNDEGKGYFWGKTNYGQPEAATPRFMLNSDYISTLTSSFTYSTRDYGTDSAVGYARIQTSVNNTPYDYTGHTVAHPGYRFAGWSGDAGAQSGVEGGSFTRAPRKRAETLADPTWVYAVFVPRSYSIVLDFQDGLTMESVEGTYDEGITLPNHERLGFALRSWSTQPDGGGNCYAPGDEVPVSSLVDGSGELSVPMLYAQWERVDFNLGFDVDSEPGDEDYPGIEKPDETVNVESGPTAIEDPKRPGYVFQGWVIPNADGTEAIDQDLVYQDETDGKWYIDASKLPDYANDDGRVELTARWTSVISVDVPSAVTFYADVVTQGNESREGAASSAFGQNKVASQSQVDLRIVGLESTAVATEGTTLGADSILKKSDAATPSSSTQKLFSLYPTDKALTADDLQDPDAVSQAKPADAVDFALDDLLLEKSFAADAFTIPAGDTLNLGYRLNLSETGTELDYDTLSTLDEGTSASIANISYCFAADNPYKLKPTGSVSDPLWVKLSYEDSNALGSLYAAPGVYGLTDIKAAAVDLSLNADNPANSKYYALYSALLARQITNGGNPGEGPYFQLKVEGAVDDYLDLQLIGICQDTKSDGTGKAGLTFQMRDIYAFDNTRSIAAGGGAFNYTYMNSVNTNSGGWVSCTMRTTLRSTFWSYLPEKVKAAIVGVDKHHQAFGGTSASYLQMTTDETVWLPSLYEVFGKSFANCNESEALTSVSGYVPFQYMAYQGSTGSATNSRAVKSYDGSVSTWSLRSVDRSGALYYCVLLANSGYGGYHATTAAGTAPCFCL